MSSTRIKTSFRNKKHSSRCNKQKNIIELINTFVPKYITTSGDCFTSYEHYVTYAKLLIKELNNSNVKQLKELKYYPEVHNILDLIYDLENIFFSNEKYNLNIVEHISQHSCFVYSEPMMMINGFYPITISLIDKMPNEIFKTAYAYLMVKYSRLNYSDFFCLNEKSEKPNFDKLVESESRYFDELSNEEEEPIRARKKARIKYLHNEVIKYLKGNIKDFYKYVPKTEKEKELKEVIKYLLDHISTFHIDFLNDTEYYQEICFVALFDIYYDVYFDENTTNEIQTQYEDMSESGIDYPLYSKIVQFGKSKVVTSPRKIKIFENVLQNLDYLISLKNG